jgi:hypothetical protein
MSERLFRQTLEQIRAGEGKSADWLRYLAMCALREPSGTTGPADPKFERCEVTGLTRMTNFAEVFRASAGPADAGSHATTEGIIERAEHLAETWERGRYGDKTLRLRAELTAQTLRDLLAVLAASRRTLTAKSSRC